MKVLYLDGDVLCIAFPLHAAAVNFKSNSQDVTEDSSFDLRGLKVLH